MLGTQERGLQPDQTMQLDTYELRMSPMTAEDVPLLHELSVSVGWPYRKDDWLSYIDLGQGVVARDEIGRILGSAMWMAMGPELATIGAVITSPRLQSNGTGRWLMGHVLDQTAAHRGLVLNATKASYRLYLSLGFQSVATVYQHNGIVRALPSAPGGTRAMRPEDAAQIHTLDTAAFGIARPHVLRAILPIASGRVLERDGQITGFALRRKFGRGHVLGPVVAETDEEAIALIAPLVADFQGKFLRMDTRATDSPLRQFLAEAGIALYSTVTTMTLRQPVQAGPPELFGLVSHTLG